MKHVALVGYFSLVIAAFAAVASLDARGAVREVASSEAAVAEGGASGGDIVYRFASEDGTVEYAHIFTNTTESAKFTITEGSPIARKALRILVVAGGGSGGNDCGGGGGAGGLFMDDARALAPGEYTITVGAGAPAWTTSGTNHHGENGGDTIVTFGEAELIRVLGGGGGGTWDSNEGRNGSAGGSGGGGCCVADNGGASTQQSTFGYGLGNAGGGGLTPWSYAEVGGGGGGAGGAGGSATSSRAGDGGAGITSDITGEVQVYAAGGGGGGVSNSDLPAGSGGGVTTDTNGDGGDNSRVGRSGAPATGSGGGGGGRGGYRQSGGGGSGVVVIRYKIPVAQGDDVVTGEVNGQTFYKFGSSGTFKVTGIVKARVLAVGGGGAGANAGMAGDYCGGAGGGGAGGMIDDTFYFSEGSYAIVVGEGGVAAGSDDEAAQGADGLPTYITTPLADGVYTNLFAYGGGGGGMAESATLYKGRDGGSGGGGSWFSSALFAGGASLQAASSWGGYGFAGGNGVLTAIGAGGGGAGAAGADADTANQGGAGGAGRLSDITGEALYYAAGGGGGTMADQTVVQTGGAGGSGIGGNGASATLTTYTPATAGIVNTGSGGGGGGYMDIGGSGGSGVVVIRIEQQRSEPLEKPAENLGSILYEGVRDYSPWDAYDPTFMDVTGTIVARAVGSYKFTVTLKPGLRWSDGSTDPVTCTWKVVKQTLGVEKFSITGWQAGEAPNSPVLVSTPTLEESWRRFDISDDGGATWREWTPEEALEAGSYKLRLVVYSRTGYTIPAGWARLSDGGYWRSAMAVDFTVWEYSEDLDLPDYLGYHTVFTVTTDPGETLADFPMLVHITEETVPGIYRHTRSDLSDIRFTLPGEPETQLPFEIDTWNPEGESLVWVKVPEYKLGAQVVLNWGEIVETDSLGVVSPVRIPDTAEGGVWDDYLGVWHFNEEVDAASAPTTPAADSSGHGYAATPYRYSTQGDLAVMVAQDGAIGNARVNGVRVDGVNDYTWFRVNNFDNGSIIGEPFTFSGWFSAAKESNSPVLVSAKAANASTTAGWEVRMQSNATTVNIYGYGQSGTEAMVSGTAIRGQGFVHITFVYDTIEGDPDHSLVSMFSHGARTGHHEVTDVSISAATQSTGGLGFGGNLGAGRSFWGALDELRIRKGAVSAAWSRAEYDQAAGTCTAGGLMLSRNRTFLNRWLSEPSASATSIEYGDTIVVNPGEGVYGSTNVVWYFQALDGSSEPVQDSSTLEPGAYILVFRLPEAGDAGTRRWTGLEESVIITVSKSSPTYRLGDAAEVTRCGRIFLANDDTNPSQPVEGQSYYLAAGNVTGANATYWVHSNESPSGLERLYAGTTNTLRSVSPVAELCGATDIWRLENVRIGNTYDFVGGVPQLSASRNYLPQAKTAKAVSSSTGATGSAAESSWFAMRNTHDAAIYSPCYTNGIGSIYFDAVNSSISHLSGGNECFRIKVQVCTNSTDLAIPTDENILTRTPVMDEQGNQTGAYTTNRYAKADWITVDMTAIKIVNGVIVSTAKTDELALDIETGGRIDSFYRVIVENSSLGLDPGSSGLRKPVRFRILRSGMNYETQANADDAGSFLLLDNIEVSPAPAGVDLSPSGSYDPEKGGFRVTGWGGAFDPAFPSITSGDIYARMDGDFHLNYLSDSSDDGSDMVVAAIFHYRWRNLNQVFDPAGGKSWKSTLLSPTDGFRSIQPLEVPRSAGDIEFWTETLISAPFYSYCDYSGLGLGTHGYSEEVTIVTNRCHESSVPTKTLGSDWFVRLRDGSSEWEEFDVTVISGSGSALATNTYHASLFDDSTWRCFLKTPTNETGLVRFRIEGRNRQTNGSRQWNDETVLFAIDGSSVGDDSSQQGKLSASFVSKPEFTDNDWYPLEIDAKTGYLLFQMDDTARSITVVHADYQNFNEWSDAVKGDTFVGSFSEDEGGPASGVSVEKQSFESDFSTWNNMSASSAYWKETFTTSTEVDTTLFLSDALTFNGWNADDAKYVHQSFSSATVTSDGATEYALQMRGNARGSVGYSTSGSRQPRGIDTLSFTTRLANTIDWDDICYSYKDGMVSKENYTFVAGVTAVTNVQENLLGAYTVSLIANYHPTKGCYEFRYVQYDATQGRLQLWKWRKEGSKMKSYLLGSGHWRDLGSNAGITGSSDKWAKMAISVTNEVDGVRIIGALKQTRETYGGTEEHGAVRCYAVEFFDQGKVGGRAFTKGTVGLASASCPAQFYKPRYYDLPLYISDTQRTTNVGTADNDPGPQDGFIAYGGAFDVIFPSTSYSPQEALTSAPEVVDEETGEMEYEDWSLAPGRMIPKEFLTGANGFQATAPTQTLGIFLAEPGSSSFSGNPVATVDVSSFSTNNSSVVLRTVDDSSLQIRTIDYDNPAEVVIDNLEFTQWRGEDWENLGTEVISTKPSRDYTRYAYTNYTFTSCWVTNHTVLMSARRTSPDGHCSIVSPLMDGWKYNSGYQAGTGLGQISFRYHGAQTNACIAVQVFTNSTASTQGDAYSYAWEKDGWITITNFTFEADSEIDQSEGIRSCYIGMRGVHGLIRLAVADELVTQVADCDDPTAFGEIYIDGITVRDEPDVDYRAWWGWNIRTLGDNADSEKRMLLGDVSESTLGLSLAINNSVTDGIYDDDYASYRRHLPFVQSPTFGTNMVGAVAFKARKYAYTSDEASNADALNARPAFITLYGSEDGEENGSWHWLKDWEITSTSYASFQYSTSSAQTYKAFRFVVRGVQGIEAEEDYDNAPGAGVEKWDYGYPVRILLDEMVVTEAIRPRVGFRAVGAFRSDLNGTFPVPGVPGESEQPLCKEGWGVQCEIYKAQLPEMIDLESETNPPEVYLHWYSGEYPWGYSNWRTNANARTNIKLMRAESEEGEGPSYVYRSSYLDSATIVPESSTPGTVVQYMLEVRYNQYDDDGAVVRATNLLNATDWPIPDWYRPLDYNATKTGGFSAYNILDTVAPHWAWINEVNVLGVYENFANTDANCQYIEVAAPADADLTGWSLRLVAYQGTEVITNNAAVFGVGGLSGTKDLRYADVRSGMTFHVIGSPQSQEAAGGLLKYSDGTLDGVWTVDGRALVYGYGEIQPFQPIAVQLVRPTGIFESEFVAIGTNYYASIDTEYARQFHPTNTVKLLNANMPGAAFLYAGSDDNTVNGIITNSLSVVTNVGGSYACWTNETYSCWTNAVGRTPGRININQVIEGTPPSPGGMSRIIFSDVTGPHIWQWDEDIQDWTTNEVAMYVRRNVSTNILYKVGNWHVLDGATWLAATSNTAHFAHAEKKPGGANEWFVGIGTNVSANITVTAQAAASARASELIGEDNRFREAILDWLATGESLYGDKWQESDELYLAEFRDRNDNYQGDLTLTQMYWLDIPPTTSNMWLKGGLWDFKYPIERYDCHYYGETNRNYQMGIEMFVTNANDASANTVNGKRAWAPYILRGEQPGSTSFDWISEGGIWTGPTFNVDGKKFNLSASTGWITLMRFAFAPNSFDENFRSLVEIEDVTSEYSPAYWEFLLQEGEFIDSDYTDDPEEVLQSPPFFRWNISERLSTQPIKLLAPTNTMETYTAE